MLIDAPPADLPIAGIIPFSPTDWPGHLVATAFTQGCPLTCRYCHNPSLQQVCPGTARISDVLDLLEQRRGLLDGAVISGGEPLMHSGSSSSGLAVAIARVHEAGFLVGLHTSGYAPARLARLLSDPACVPDWVGLDIKALPADFPLVSRGSARVAAGAWECLEMLLHARVEVTVRTTLWPGSVLEKHLPELKAQVARYGLPLTVQWARGVDKAGFFLNTHP